MSPAHAPLRALELTRRSRGATTQTTLARMRTSETCSDEKTSAGYAGFSELKTRHVDGVSAARFTA